MSCDPISIKGGLNLFNFVSNNPIIYIDKIGLKNDKLDAGSANTPMDGSPYSIAGCPSNGNSPQESSSDKTALIKSVLSSPSLDMIKLVTEDKIQDWIKHEHKPTFFEKIGYDDTSVEHQIMVLTIVKYYLNNKGTRQDTNITYDSLAYSHSQLIKDREKNSQSILLRDAERFMWGAKMQVFLENEEDYGRGSASFMADIIDPAYNLFKKTAFISGFEKMTRTDKNSPSSAVGGSLYYQLGRRYFFLNEDTFRKDVQQSTTKSYLEVPLPIIKNQPKTINSPAERTR